MTGQPLPADAPMPGLPPVQPPTGQMILRLFLVPFLIVAVLIGLYLLGHAFRGKMGRSRSADAYLRNLDSANPDIRWRAASDLSQELPRSPELAANAVFALELVERLGAALDENAAAEKDFAARHEKLSEGGKERRINKELAPGRKLSMFLSACLGNFVVPVGVPVLKHLATQSSDMEPDALAERRAGALLSLAALGKNLERYDELPDGEKDRIEEELAAAGRRGDQGRWALPVFAYLRDRREGKPDSFGVAEALRLCSEDEGPFLRELAALASNFWKGNAKEEAAIEEFLVRLSRDTGQGEEKLFERQSANPDNRRSRAVTRRKGFQVQVNANLALARRGSPRVRLDLLEEMLDPDALSEVFILRTRPAARGDQEREQPNEALVAVTVTGSLKAVAELHRLRPEMKLDRVREKVEALTKHTNAALRAEAEVTLNALQGK